MRNFLIAAVLMFCAQTASATPFIRVITEEIKAIMSDSATINSCSAILTSIKLVKHIDENTPARVYEIDSVGFDSEGEVCKVLVSATYVTDEPNCLAPPGGRCPGSYNVQVLDVACK